jgi:hypothetical protein
MATYEAASNWNDYVALDGVSDCDPTMSTGLRACWHGGEHRRAFVPGVSDCTDVSAVDSLGVFEWTCDDDGVVVTVYTRSLAVGAGLADLIDFQTPSWKPMSLTIQRGSLPPITTAPTTWWTNTVVDGVSAGTLDTASTIYALTSSPGTALTVAADQVALVMAPGAALDAGGANVIVDVSQQHHFWFEGTVDMTTSSYGILLLESHASIVRNLSTVGPPRTPAATAVYIGGASRSTHIRHVEGNHDIEIREGATHCSVAHVDLFDSAVVVDDAPSASIRDVRLSGGNATLGVYGSADDAVVSHVRVHNSLEGIGLLAPRVRADDIVVTNVAGVSLFVRSAGGVVSNVVSANHQGDGIFVDRSDGLLLSSLVLVNNGGQGMQLQDTTNVVVRDLLAAHNPTGIFLDDADATFTGLLLLGNTNMDCAVTPAASGLTAACANEAASDASLSTGQNAGSSFVAKVVTDDMVNQSDTNGTALAGMIDVTHFESRFRTWGRDGSAFPNADHRSVCTTGSCRIWDWSLSSTDVVIRDRHGVPTGDEIVMVGAETALLHAVEILADDAGDDDLLCESTEVCRTSPNLGAYQGHGDIETVAFTDGAVTGVELVRRTINGSP